MGVSTPESSLLADEPSEGAQSVTSSMTGGNGGSGAPAVWKGSDRYEVLRSLGEGGTGCVYEAYDRQRRERVAIKTLRHVDAGALYRFKQEFRTLADVRHPNLVQLHELVADDKDHILFSMELVQGSDFLRYVSGSVGPVPTGESAVRPVVRDPRGRGLSPPQNDRAPGEHRSIVDYNRLRSALIQLVEGIAALHAAGKLHRDLKPFNVRVTPDGRVVILDFGVATELRGPRNGEGSVEGYVVGTATYMAPEQVMGEPPVVASDFYSIGVMVYEAIVGEPPYVGSALDVMTNKCRGDPLAPSTRVPGVPEDLDALCLELLVFDATKRPTADQVLRRIRASAPSASSSKQGAGTPALAGLVGRESQLTRLREAVEATRAGKAVCVRVSGNIGTGKSALMHHFLDQLEKSTDAVVLRGRTYERESVPYKAFDALIDGLTGYLVDLEARQVAFTLPAGVAALAQIFPVLRRVTSIEDAAQSKMDDPRVVRLRAFAALRELFTTLASRRLLVVFIDDVHWGDIDSAELLLELVRPPDEPPALFLMAHRSEEAGKSSFLADLNARWPEDVEVREVEVGPLERVDARRLALALLDPVDGTAELIADAVARESQGSPFLIGELVRSNVTAASAAQGSLDILTLERMVEDRAARLPDDARRLLELIAIGGRPLPIPVVNEATGMAEATPQLLSLLQASRFARVSMREGIDWVDAVHDRIRELLLGQISNEDARRYHAQLAHALELATAPDPEAIATHLLGAGDRVRAGQYARRAADAAIAKLAFAQAERLYQLAIDTLPAASPDAQALRSSMAKASEWAGHAEKAARTYLIAATYAPAGERLELERAAAAQFIGAGLIDEGVAVFHRILAAQHVRVPRSRAGFYLLTLLYRIAAALLFRLAPRDRGEVSADRQRYLNMLQTMGRVLAVLDPVSAIYIKARYLCEALWSGSTSFVLRAAILEAGSLTAAGGRPSRKERALFALARRLAEQTGDEEWLGYHDLTCGIGEYLRGRWQSCVELLDRAQVRLAAVRAWQANASIYRVYAMVSLGDLSGVKSRSKALLADAQQRGDR